MKRYLEIPLRLLRASIIGLLLAVVTIAFIASPARLSGASMLPSFKDGDYVLLLKAYRGVRYGDVIAFDSRLKRNRTILDNFDELRNNIGRRISGRPDYNLLMKRVIGLSGDILEIKEGQLYRNGELMAEPYILEAMNEEAPKQYIVPEGCVFVLGDNRNDSVDSRELGPIPLDHITGKVIF